MASFCRDCTIEYFGEELADKNDMIADIADDEVILDLCEGCGYGYFDKTGKKVIGEQPIHN